MTSAKIDLLVTCGICSVTDYQLPSLKSTPSHRVLERHALTIIETIDDLTMTEHEIVRIHFHPFAGDLGQLPACILGSALDGVAGEKSYPRSECPRIDRGGSRLDAREMHIIHPNTENLRRNHGQYGIGSLSHIGRARRQLNRAVLLHSDLRCGGGVA